MQRRVGGEGAPRAQGDGRVCLQPVRSVPLRSTRAGKNCHSEAHAGAWGFRHMQAAGPCSMHALHSSLHMQSSCTTLSSGSM